MDTGYTFGNSIGEKVKIGFYAARNDDSSGNGDGWTFSDLTINGQKVDMSHDNNAPVVARKSGLADTVSCVSYDKGVVTLDTNKLEWTDSDNTETDQRDTPKDYIVKWMVSDDATNETDGIYYIDPSVAYAGVKNENDPTKIYFRVPPRFANKRMKALVIPQDSHGLCGAPYISKTVLIPDEVKLMPSSVSVTAANNTRVVNQWNQTVAYTAKVLPDGALTTVTWSVVDAATGDATECAEVNAEGVLTAKKNGVVEVIAKTASGLTGREILVINQDERTVSNNIKISDENDEKWSIPSDGTIQLTPIAGGLWEGKKPSNCFTYNVTNAENLTAMVKMTGRAANNWVEAGLTFFVDERQYVFIGRKYRGGANTERIKLSYWTGTGSAVEKAYGTDNLNDEGSTEVTDTPIYLKLEKTGDSFTASWSPDKSSWNTVGTVQNAALKNNFKVGFYAGKNDNSNASELQFSELEINGNKIPLTTVNHAPSITSAACHYDETTKAVSATYEGYRDADNDTEGQPMIRYLAAKEQTGPYYLAENEDELANQYVKALVFPQDSHGMYGAPVESAAIHVGETAIGKTLQSAESALKSASVAGVNFDNAFQSGTLHYIATAGKDVTSVQASFAAKDTTASLSVSLNGTKLFPAEGGTGASQVSNLPINLKSGINVIHADVTAEDGKTKSAYRFVIVRTGDTNADLSNIKVNNTDLTDFDKDKLEYEYSVSEDTKTLKVAATPAFANASVKIAANGKVAAGEMEVSLQPGRNDVAICVTPETKFPQKLYQVAVYVPNKGSANLQKLSFDSGVVLKDRFASDQLSYEGTVTASNANLTLEAEDADAKIELVVNGQTLSKANTAGSLTEQLTFVKGSNRLQVKVTSSDGSNTKTYALKLNGVTEVMLSDLDWDPASTTGWKSIQKNKSVEGNPIRLSVPENGENVTKTFESGIGGHADMNLIYTLDPQFAFTKFVTWIGVDKEITATASMKFFIYLDDSGDSVWSSGNTAVTWNDPAQKAEVTLNGASKIRIFADKDGDNGSDHVSLGDAKFLTALDSTDEYYDVEYRSQPKGAATITAAASGADADVLEGDGYIRAKAGSSVTLTAAKATGHENDTFVGWYDESGKLLSDQTSYTVSNLTDDVVCFALLKSQKQAELESKIDTLKKTYTDEKLKEYEAGSVTEYRKALKNAEDALADEEKKDDKLGDALTKLTAAANGLIKCDCEISALNAADKTVTMQVGQVKKTVSLEPSAQVTGSCGAQGHSDSNDVHYSYTLKDAGTTGATLNAAPGIVTVRDAGTATITVKAELASGVTGKRSKETDVTVTVTRLAEGEILPAEKDFSIASSDDTDSKEGYRILVVKRGSRDDGDVGANHLTGHAKNNNAKPGDNKIALLQFDLSEYKNNNKTLEKAYLRLCMAAKNSNNSLEEDSLNVAVIPAESGLTDLTTGGPWSWSAVKTKFDEAWTTNKVRLMRTGSLAAYGRDSSVKDDMDIRTKDNTPLDKTAYYVDITQAVRDALADGQNQKLILAVNETKNIEHYFINSVGAKGADGTAKFTNADATMAPSLRIFYEGEIPETYSLTYRRNGENVTDMPKNLIEQESGTSVQKPDDPKRTGYNFMGWSETSDGTTAIGWPIELTANRDLYAIWEAVTYSVTFDADGGTPVPEAQQVESGNKATRPTAPTKADHTFAGWFKEGETTEYNFDTPVTTDIKLVAHWNKVTKTCTVTFDADGGTPVPEAQQIESGNKATRPTAPTKTDHTFAGWFKEGETTEYNFDTPVTTDIKLIAHWTKLPCTCELVEDSLALNVPVNLEMKIPADKDNSTQELQASVTKAGDCQLTGHGASGSVNAATIDYKLKEGGKNTAGATLVGKNLTVTQEGDVEITVTAKIDTGKDGKTLVTKDFTVKARKLKDGISMVYFNANADGDPVDNMPSEREIDTTVEANKQVEEPEEIPTRTGYTFQFWSLTKDGDKVSWPYTVETSEVTFHAIWKKNPTGEDITEDQAEEAVKEALSNAKETYDFCMSGDNANNYTKQTWEAFMTAYEKALKALKPETDIPPADLNKLAVELDAAQKALKPDEEKADENAKSALTNADAAYGAANDGYTKALWDAYAMARENLQNAQNAADKIRYQIDLAAAEAKLYAEAENLLDAEVTAAGKYKKADYTAATWGPFETALKKAQTPPADATAKKLRELAKELKLAAGRLQKTNTQTPKPPTPPAAAQKVQSLKLTAKTYKIAQGKKINLGKLLTVLPENAANKKVTWKSSDPKLATVNASGNVSVKKKPGKKVQITATAADGSGVSVTATIQIMKNAVTKITLKGSKSVKAGKKVKLKATVKTNGKKANKTLEWKSSNEKYATVNKKGQVSTKKAGAGKTVTITATATDGSNKKGKIKIKIKK